MKDKQCRNKGGDSGYPFSDMPRLAGLGAADAGNHPDDAACFALWDKYAMLPNVRRHSLLVAKIAGALAERARTLGICDCLAASRASGLLHDLAKTWCLRYGGAHAMIGAAWTVADTGDYQAAQGVMLHVHWPWSLPAGNAICCVPIFVLYADKRARHDQCVTIGERFEDLLVRYGQTENARKGIRASFEQVKLIERELSSRLDWDLNEDTFDSRRLVQ